MHKLHNITWLLRGRAVPAVPCSSVVRNTFCHTYLKVLKIMFLLFLVMILTNLATSNGRG